MAILTLTLLLTLNGSNLAFAGNGPSISCIGRDKTTCEKAKEKVEKAREKSEMAKKFTQEAKTQKAQKEAEKARLEAENLEDEALLELYMVDFEAFMEEAESNPTGNAPQPKRLCSFGF